RPAPHPVGLAFLGHSALNQDGLAAVGDLDAGLLEASLHPAVEFPLHRPAAVGGAADLADDRSHRAVDLVHAPEFEIAADQGPIVGLATHLGDDVREDLPDPVGVLLVGYVDADGGVAGAAAGVGDAGDRTERNDMHRAVAGAQPNGPDRQVLDRSGQA